MGEYKATVILGVIGADCHSVGIRILEGAFSKAGFEVLNLGVTVSKKEFVEAAVENEAQAILVSSLYGQAELDCRGLRKKCQEAGIGDIILYLGGNLVVGETDFPEVQRKFKNMGFDRVFPPDVDLNTCTERLAKDLELKFGIED